MLECVLNLSEGRSAELVAEIAGHAGDALIDLHRDPWHNRSVLTLAGDRVFDAAQAVTSAAVERLDLSSHEGAHPRLGVIDVVPFVPIDDRPETTDLSEAIRVRDRFARWAGDHLDLPCFTYGPERSLPEVRRGAFSAITPDTGPAQPHRRAGACCVGARPVLVVYNVWLDGGTLGHAQHIARSLRSPSVRALAFELDGHLQVSCNLIAPLEIGPAVVYDAVATQADVDRAELVGLIPAAVLEQSEPGRWSELDLAASRTIEARLAATANDFSR